MPSDHLLTTFTGRLVDPLRLHAEDIDPRDIAHALSLTCRSGGHKYGQLNLARQVAR